ncbi:MAG: BrnA antitoxin family protein [Anaerolineae bacterium]|nr:BrnA antitoxin family protein [Anaerolineae bacterium]
MLKEIPVFQCADEERAFWATHDIAEYFPWNEAGEGLRPLCNQPTLWPMVQPDVRCPTSISHHPLLPHCTTRNTIHNSSLIIHNSQGDPPNEPGSP